MVNNNLFIYFMHNTVLMACNKTKNYLFFLILYIGKVYLLSLLRSNANE